MRNKKVGKLPAKYPSVIEYGDRRSTLSHFLLFILHFSFLLLLAGLVSCSKKSSGNSNPPPVTPPAKPDTTVVPVKTDVAFWLTKSDQTVLLQKQNIGLLFGTTANSSPMI